MLHKITTFTKMPWTRKVLYLKTSVLIVVCRFLLSVVSFKTVRYLLQRFTLSGKPEKKTVQYSPSEIAGIVKLTSKHLLKKRPCLVQALVLWLLYRRSGYPAEIRIGVRTNGSEQFQAHAWVEHNGRIAIGWVPELPEYKVLPSFDLAEINEQSRVMSK